MCLSAANAEWLSIFSKRSFYIFSIKFENQKISAIAAASKRNTSTENRSSGRFRFLGSCQWLLSVATGGQYFSRIFGFFHGKSLSITVNICLIHFQKCFQKYKKLASEHLEKDKVIVHTTWFNSSSWAWKVCVVTTECTFVLIPKITSNKTHVNYILKYYI